ncbi:MULTISPECIES: hypothetical protein [unclassified Sphingomonas]|jgi:hypothetical protein|uniref:hypothetical protein n=1 Tax=unclassified Sphingomonas TaxID=196159 RepID=UPI000AEABC8E|nr:MULTISPECIES: hypothetical protein [unclassified Sphingomonas]
MSRTILVGLIGLVISGCEDKAEQDAARAEAAAKQKAERQQADAAKLEFERREAEKRRQGFHCLSSWDGSNRSLVDQVKEGLRDPNSFEHDETRIAPVTATGNHPIAMKYRARNGFGGMNVEEVVGAVDPTDCSATIITTMDEFAELLGSQAGPATP